MARLQRGFVTFNACGFRAFNAAVFLLSTNVPAFVLHLPARLAGVKNNRRELKHVKKGGLGGSGDAVWLILNVAR